MVVKEGGCLLIILLLFDLWLLFFNWILSLAFLTRTCICKQDVCTVHLKLEDDASLRFHCVGEEVEGASKSSLSERTCSNFCFKDIFAWGKVVRTGNDLLLIILYLLFLLFTHIHYKLEVNMLHSFSSMQSCLTKI